MKENLFKILTNKQISKDEKLENKIKEFKNYFNDFFHKFSPFDIYKLSKLTEIEIIKANIIVSNPFKITETLDLIDSYNKLFQEKNLKELLSILHIYTKNSLFRIELNNCLNNDISNFQRNMNLTKIFAKEGLNLQTTLHFSKFIKTNVKNIEKIKNTFESFLPISENECISLIFAKKEFNNLINDSEIKELENFLNNNDRKYLKKTIIPEEKESKELIKTASIFSEMINSKYIKIVKDYEQSEKERRRHNKNIEDLIEILNTNKEITNINEILKLCPDVESTNLVADYIIYHNQEIYKELVITYEKTLTNTDENLSTLFKKYNFIYENLETIEKDKIKELPYNEIELLLSRLFILSITNINISKVDPNKLTIIEDLISKGLINKNWINQNQDLLFYENNILDLIKSNLELLSSKGINIIYYENSLDILKSELLKYNLNILETYYLTINKNTTNINFLNNENLKEKIDFLISIGLYQEIESLDILNYSLIEFYKLKIANSLNISIDIIDIEEKDLINDYTNKIIPITIINKLNDNTDNIVDLPFSLEKYRIDKVTLDINGVLVSSEKIKRNLDKLESNDNISCFYAIIYNSHYNYEELETLSDTILNENILNNFTHKKYQINK